MNVTLNGKPVEIISRNRGWYVVKHEDGATQTVRSSALNIDNSADVAQGTAPVQDVAPVVPHSDAVQPGADVAPAPHQETAMARKTKRTAKTADDKPAKKARKAAKAPKAKKAAKAAKSSRPTRAAGATVAVILNDGKEYSYKMYGKTPAGHASYDNGDKVAQMLRGKDLSEVYTMTAKHMFKANNLKGDFAGCTTVDGIERKLRTSLKDANPGRQRMTLGNRLRAAVRAIDAK